MEIFYIFFAICFISYMFRTFFHFLENRKSNLVKSKRIYPMISIAMFFLWFSWFAMAFNDVFEMTLPYWLTYTGLVLFLTGVVFVVLSHTKIKGFQSKALLRSGIYSRIRHPMYLGFILWIIGFPIFLQGLLTLASAFIWVPQILYWKASEEKKLEKEYKEYEEYKKKTWF